MTTYLLADRQRASMYSDLVGPPRLSASARATLSKAEEVGERRIINDVVPRLADDLMDLDEFDEALACCSSTQRTPMSSTN